MIVLMRLCEFLPGSVEEDLSPAGKLRVKLLLSEELYWLPYPLQRCLQLVFPCVKTINEVRLPVPRFWLQLDHVSWGKEGFYCQQFYHSKRILLVSIYQNSVDFRWKYNISSLASFKGTELKILLAIWFSLSLSHVSQKIRKEDI